MIKQLRALKNHLFQMFWTGIVALYFYDKSTQVLHGNRPFLAHGGLDTHHRFQNLS